LRRGKVRTVREWKTLSNVCLVEASRRTRAKGRVTLARISAEESVTPPAQVQAAAPDGGRPAAAALRMESRRAERRIR
jgi:hypothetical protein